jgi:hypothetical protein
VPLTPHRTATGTARQGETKSLLGGRKVPRAAIARGTHLVHTAAVDEAPHLTVGLVLALVLLVAGGLVMVGSSFADSMCTAGSPGGKAYAQVSAAAFADPTNTASRAAAQPTIITIAVAETMTGPRHLVMITAVSIVLRCRKRSIE